MHRTPRCWSQCCNFGREADLPAHGAPTMTTLIGGGRGCCCAAADDAPVDGMTGGCTGSVDGPVGREAEVAGGSGSGPRVGTEEEFEAGAQVRISARTRVSKAAASFSTRRRCCFARRAFAEAAVFWDLVTVPAGFSLSEAEAGSSLRFRDWVTRPLEVRAGVMAVEGGGRAPGLQGRWRCGFVRDPTAIAARTEDLI